MAGAPSYCGKQDQCFQGRHVGHQASRPHVATAGAVTCCVLGVLAVGGGKALSSASPSKLNVLQQPQHARFPGNPAEGKESPTKSFNMQNLRHANVLCSISRQDLNLKHQTKIINFKPKLNLTGLSLRNATHKLAVRCHLCPEYL